MRKIQVELLIFLFSLSAFAGASLQVKPDLGKIVGKCKAQKASRHVWIFKQWHLSPSVNTRDTRAAKTLPQEQNQASIYRQLDSWIGRKQLNEIYAEGCSGELNSNSTLNYNGWSIGDLRRATMQASYSEILTSVPLKLEAKYGKAVFTMCGDDETLVKENNLAFSDARGAMGFLTRLTQYKNDPTRAKPYLESTVELYKLPKETTADQAIAKLRAELKSSVKRAKDLIEKRNEHLVKLVKESAELDVAVVYGGIHSAGIKKLLDDSGIGCTIIEPTGYQNDEAVLLQKLDEAIDIVR